MLYIKLTFSSSKWSCLGIYETGINGCVQSCLWNGHTGNISLMGAPAVSLLCKIHELKTTCVYGHRCSVCTQAAWTMDPQGRDSPEAGAILVLYCCYKNCHKRRGLKPDTVRILELRRTSLHRLHQANSKGLTGLCSCLEVPGMNSFPCHFQLSVDPQVLAQGPLSPKSEEQIESFSRESDFLFYIALPPLSGNIGPTHVI